jgi:hypothetical protein
MRCDAMAPPQNLLFAPGELVPPGDLNIVIRGLALHGGKLR